MAIDIRLLSPDCRVDFASPIGAAFGIPISPERIERIHAVPELSVRLGAYEGSTVVGTAGSFTFAMTVPGGVTVETAGLTMVAVLPTHRRRGILRSLMRRHLDDVHACGLSVAALYASEGSIYGRFGYGMGSLSGEADILRERTAFARAVDPRGEVRLLSEDEATAAFPSIWDRVRLSTPGMLARSETWWRVRRTSDPDWLRAGRGPLQRAWLTLDGRPAAYALYRFSAPIGHRTQDVVLEVTEAMADSPAATRAIWRFLFDIDLATRFIATHLPVDHPLFFLLAEPRRLRLTLSDALWVRLVDVAPALSKRGYAGDGAPLVIEVEDAFCPWNTGRYRLAGGHAERTAEEADLTLDAEALGALYLGGFGATQLAQAGRVVERRPGALRRADVLFRAERGPWCPETF